MVSTKWLNGYEDLTDCHAIRRAVFIQEQNVSESIEMDDKDELAMHIVLYENGLPAATARVVLEDDEYSIGRVAVLKQFRGRHYGDFAMRLAIRRIFNSGGYMQYVHAQTAVRGFYEKLGFVAYGEEYMEAGIPHIHMKREGDISC